MTNEHAHGNPQKLVGGLYAKAAGASCCEVHKGWMPMGWTDTAELALAPSALAGVGASDHLRKSVG